MNSSTIKNYTKGILFLVMILTGLVLITACGRKITFTRSSVVPAAEGSVKLKKDKNGNYDIDIYVMRLADPKRLNPPKDSYVVWMKTDDAGTINIGQLKTSSSLLSKALKSSLKTVTSSKPTGFFITAENNAAIQYPEGEVVLQTGAF